MLSKLQRLNLRTNFKWVVSGKSITAPLFKIFYRVGENTEPKIGVSISGSQFKKAVQRNKAKRICFKISEEHLGLLPKNLNLVIMPRNQVLATDIKILSDQFSNAISNIKIN